MVALRLFLASLGFLLCAFLLDTGYAIRCYECNSHNDSRCAEEKLPAELEKECTNPIGGTSEVKYTMCRKITQTIEFEVNGLQPDSRVIRGCGWDESNYKGKCYQRSGFGGRQEVCSCTTDLCNGTSSLKAMHVLFFISQIALLAKLLL